MQCINEERQKELDSGVMTTDEEDDHLWGCDVCLEKFLVSDWKSKQWIE